MRLITKMPKTWFIMLNMVSFHLLFIPNSFSQSMSKRMNVDSLVRVIDSRKGYKISSVDAEEFSSEGSKFTGFFDSRKQLCKLKVEHYGVMGKINREYYLFRDTLIYQRIVTFTYDKPFYEVGYKTQVDSLKCPCLLYPKKCGDSMFLKEKKFLLQKLNLK